MYLWSMLEKELVAASAKPLTLSLLSSAVSGLWKGQHV
jgi:hypothetical protein